MNAQGPRIVDAEQSRVLAEVLAVARDERCVVVFDLDSTLFDNRPRQARILHEYGVSAGLAVLTKTTPRHFTSWRLTDAMRNVGLDERRIEEHAKPARAFWLQRFFTSAYCEDDVPIAGAVAYVNDVAEAGAQVAYVTGRHAAMGPGTVANFARWGFPLPDERRVYLLLKPRFEIGDDEWKQQAYARLDELGVVVAAFDNEPAHINVYAERYPGALCVRLATDDSGRPIPLLPSVRSIASFVRA